MKKSNLKYYFAPVLAVALLAGFALFGALDEGLIICILGGLFALEFSAAVNKNKKKKTSTHEQS